MNKAGETRDSNAMLELTFPVLLTITAREIEFIKLRIGNAPDATLLIYSFKPSAKLPQHIHLRNAMLDVIGRRFAPIFSEEFTKEILKKAERGS